MTDTPDALASALPADVQMISLDGIERDHGRRIGQLQAERLAEAGYVLVHTAPDEATVERLARAGAEAEGFAWDLTMPEARDSFRDNTRGVLAALADPAPQARCTVDEATGGA